jgi:hypothetical protein
LVVERTTHGGEHAPETQVRPWRQSLPQLPQFCSSSCKFTHAPLQAMVGGWQGTMQIPPEQISVPPQSMSLQHSAQPVGQHRLPEQPGCEQVPPLHASAVQTSPSEHCAGLQHAWQVAPQSLGVAAAHEHEPPEQMAPGLHGRLQPPQFCSSLTVGVSQPGAAVQSPNPASHSGCAFTQCVLGGTGMPQPPQFWLLVSVSTQDPAHSVRLPEHPLTHCAPSQSAVGAMQTLPHAPHESGLDLLDSQSELPPQFKNAGSHLHPCAPHTWLAAHESKQTRQSVTVPSGFSQPSDI